MRIRFSTILFVLVALVAPAGAQVAPDSASARDRYVEDFDVFWQFVADEYAYFEQKQTDWQRVRSLYGPEAARAADDRAFLNVLERALGELYDAHAGFDTNNRASPRLVPSGTDLWAEWRGGQAIITAVRAGSAAERAGLQPGMIVRTIDGETVREAVRAWLPHTLRESDPAAWNWALRTTLAGTHAEPVRLTAEGGGRTASYEFTPGVDRPGTPLTVDTLRHHIGYLRVNNALGDIGLVAAFDSALVALRGTRGLVLDLRDTPSGGNSAVARGVMSRLVQTERPYQRHELVTEQRAFGVRRVWVEYVTPRGPFAYTRPVVVLVGRWTGSMGEGVAIGLDGMERATIVGTPMAGLQGAVSERALPNTGIVARIPTERIMHVDGSPREAFVPPVVVPPGSSPLDGGLEQDAGRMRDAGVQRAVDLLNRDR